MVGAQQLLGENKPWKSRIRCLLSELAGVVQQFFIKYFLTTPMLPGYLHCAPDILANRNLTAWPCG